MRKALAAIGLVAGMLLPSGCGTAGEDAPTPSPTAADAGPPTSTQAAESTAAQPTTPVPGPAQTTSWTMPNLVGQNLQAAQDAIQALTGNAIFFTTSHDASGQNRSQVVDSNWVVCSQNIAPGATITASSQIDFGAVKSNETCP